MGIHLLIRMLSKLLVLLLFHLVVANFVDSLQQLSCHAKESSALLQFKESFIIINKSASKVSSWKPAGGGNSSCCSWDGVECDKMTGHVIGLDLGSSFLYGSFDSNSSLFSLVHLQRLILSKNNFNYSQIPSRIRNFPSLTHLDLSASFFSGQVPSEVSHLSKLTYLSLCCNVLEIETSPSYNPLRLLKLQPSVLRSLVQNLTSLETLYLTYINISSIIPVSLTNLSFLRSLSLSNCDLFGEFPVKIFNLQNLKGLSVSHNQDLTGYFPEFNQSSPLVAVGVASTRFFGTIPSSIEKLNKLQVLDVHQCNFSNFLVPSAFGNKFTGEILPLLCNMNSLLYLDLSKNNFSGTLPQCLGNFSDGLKFLHLGSNSFHGMMPQSFNNRSSLRMIDVSHNQLQGQLPRSLANCVMLEYLVLSNNQFSDVFPIWLGTLPKLKLLAMRHNGFNGVIGHTRTNIDFPKLHILDLSYNNFTGEIPPLFPDITVNKSTYMSFDIDYQIIDAFDANTIVNYSIIITIKGQELYYSKILEGLIAIDFSSNKFEGKIPEFIGNLTDLRSLNISNNILTGSIPSSLGNLRKLESLDLSQNKLSGKIPQQLTQLTFLGTFDVSHNNLTGPIPQGTQLTSFNSTSYEGNLGLCGDPLPKKCGEAPQRPPSTEEDNGSGSTGMVEFVLAGIGSGFVVGVVLADVVIIRRQELFLRVVGMVRLMIWKR